MPHTMITTTSGYCGWHRLWKRAMAVLSKSAVEGAIVLRRLLRSDDSKIRLQAAKIVLEQGIKVRDMVDIAQRVAALEKIAEARKGQ